MYTIRAIMTKRNTIEYSQRFVVQFEIIAGISGALSIIYLEASHNRVSTYFIFFIQLKILLR